MGIFYGLAGPAARDTRRFAGRGSDHRPQAVDIDGGKVLDGLVFGHLAPQHPQQLLEGLLPNLLDGLVPGDDEAGIDVNVVYKPIKGVGLAADID